ncbi:phosphonate ABC transporter, permease protein PhnE [Pseudomonas aeruginosa]|nr:phosphonate ABC transporter, permease protein PhnE [Pseudomonas aeruginosa]
MSRTWRLLLWPLLVVAAVGASFAYLDMATAGLFQRQGTGPDGRLRQRVLPARPVRPAPAGDWPGLLETLAMSAIGTLLAALLGLLFALPAAGRFGVPAQSLARLLLNALRAVPELVWGALMVLAAGLGPNAGTLALALHTGGVLGRLFAEALENTPAQPAEALRLAGSGRLAAFAYGTLPGVWPQLVAYTLYRWENNIRMASVLGFVGAGGLGQMLYFSLSLFQQAQAATVILAMLILVLGVDSLSAWARQRWVSQ